MLMVQKLIPAPKISLHFLNLSLYTSVFYPFFRWFLFFFFTPLLLQATPLFWWEPSNGSQNFGDHLSKILIERMVGKEVEKASIDSGKVLAIGSILHFAKEGIQYGDRELTGNICALMNTLFKHLTSVVFEVH